ncbi:MAG: hypothetical protein HYR97_06500, partial [Candidatus Melainabacteria bacterium]|nr:hypothetical protein [Candidatus Melainabacteria bacterium]
CSLGIIIIANYDYLKPFVTEHPNVSKGILATFFVCLYIPLSVSSIDQYTLYEKKFHTIAKTNADFIRFFLKDEKPAFIYFNDGIHTPFLDYPIKQIFKDATNEQIMKANTILPMPIEYLFLKQTDWLYRINKEKILNQEPLLDSKYVMYGYTEGKQVVVYKYLGESLRPRAQG